MNKIKLAVLASALALSVCTVAAPANAKSDKMMRHHMMYHHGMMMRDHGMMMRHHGMMMSMMKRHHGMMKHHHMMHHHM